MWRQGKLEGETAYFTNAYLGLPYEVDANRFAYAKACAYGGDSEELKGLLARNSPEYDMSAKEYRALFRRIDEALAD